MSYELGYKQPIIYEVIGGEPKGVVFPKQLSCRPLKGELIEGLVHREESWSIAQGQRPLSLIFRIAEIVHGPLVKGDPAMLLDVWYHRVAIRWWLMPKDIRP